MFRKFLNIHRKAPVLEVLTQVFSFEYWQIFKDAYFEGHLLQRLLLLRV